MIKKVATDPTAILRNRYRESLKLLDQSEFNGSAADYLIGICEQARDYTWPEHDTRERDRQAVADAAQQARYARRLAKYLERHPYPTMIPVMTAILATGVHLRIAADNQPLERGVALSPSQSLRFAQLLNALADELEAGKLLAQAGPMLHRTRVGPLGFPYPIEKNADVPGSETCLALMLSFLFQLIH
jgi:hypothetical protein